MKKIFTTFIGIVLLLFLSPLFGVDDDVSAFNNTVQVQKAENLAEASFETAQLEAKSEVDSKQNIVDNAQDAFTANPTVANQQALDAALSELLDAKTALSEVSGVSLSEINEMRNSGMGWGEIANTLGVHPGTLGVGYSKGLSRNRNPNSFSVSSTKSNSSNSGKTVGLRGKSNNANARNNGQSSGKSNNAGGKGHGAGNSNSGGNGKGGGNGK